MTKEGNRVAATSSACRAIWIGLRAFDLRCVPPATGQDFRVFRETVTMNLVARFCRFLSNGQCGVSAAIQRSAQEVVGGLGGSAGNCALWATERKTLAIAHHVDLASGDVVQLVRTLPCHGRGRGFESRRPRQFFQAPASLCDTSYTKGTQMDCKCALPIPFRLPRR